MVTGALRVVWQGEPIAVGAALPENVLGDPDAALRHIHQVPEEAILDAAAEYLAPTQAIAEKFLPNHVGSLRKQLAEFTG